MIVVLDTGGVEALTPLDEKRRARLRALRQKADDIVVPAAVLAEGVFTGNVGHDFHVGRLLSAVRIAPVDEHAGHAAGRLRQAALRAGATPVPSGIDAIVVAEADARAAGRSDVQIVTSDPEDVEILASLAVHVARLSVLPA